MALGNQIPNTMLNVLRNLRPARSIVCRGWKPDRIADSQRDRNRSWNVARWRQSFKSSNKTAGHDRDIGFRDQHPESVLERHHRSIAAASAFWKDDEDRSFFL